LTRKYLYEFGGLTEQGRAARIDMIKRQPPTAAPVSYLHRQGEIDIARVDGRTNLSGARRGDLSQCNQQGGGAAAVPAAGSLNRLVA
jgi:hypothetical protein